MCTVNAAQPGKPCPSKYPKQTWVTLYEYHFIGSPHSELPIVTLGPAPLQHEHGLKMPIFERKISPTHCFYRIGYPCQTSGCIHWTNAHCVAVLNILTPWVDGSQKPVPAVTVAKSPPTTPSHDKQLLGSSAEQVYAGYAFPKNQRNLLQHCSWACILPEN